MQLQQNFPPNMFQPHQGNPPQKHPIPPLMQQTLDPSIVRDSEKKPEDPIKEGEEKLRSAIEDAEKKIEDSKNNLAQQYQVSPIDNMEFPRSFHLPIIYSGIFRF